jgi:hypothetical protein
VALWPPQLVKVRAGKRGSGWAVGQSGVLTARHVVRPHLANPYHPETNPSGVRCLAVTGGPGEGIFECAVVWQDEAADLALLQIAEGRRDVWWARLEDTGLTVLAAPGTDPIRDVSAVGFPDDTVDAGANRPDPDQPTGTLLPSSGVPGRIGFDIDTSTPDDHPLWRGLSGAAIREAGSGGRLCAVVTQAVGGRAARRLYASPLPDPDRDPGWAAALAQVEAEPILQDRYAPEARRFLTCHDPAGRRWRVGQVPQLGDFGVRRARDDLAPRHQPYFPYVGRPEADDVEAALNAALANAGAPRFVLLVGDSAAGKSRLAAEVVSRMPALAEYRFTRPVSTQRIGDLPEVFWRGGRVLLWLDDLHSYLASGLDAHQARMLLTNPRLVIVATVLREKVDELDSSGFKAAGTDLLTGALIARIDIPDTSSWSIADGTDPADARVARAALAAAGHAGVGLGEYLAAYADLRNHYRNAGPWARALIDCFADWSRTGMPTALPESIARDLWPGYLSAVHARQWDLKTDDGRESIYQAARNEATTEVLGSTALLTDIRDHGLSPSDAAIIERHTVVIPNRIWRAAAQIAAKDPAQADSVAFQAALAGQDQIAESLWAAQGDREPRALFNLGVVDRLRLVRQTYMRKAPDEPHNLAQTADSEVVGRDALCNVIIEDLHDPGTRRPQVVIGGVGVGKTALLVQLTKLLAERGVVVPVPVRLRDAQESLNFRELARARFVADTSTMSLSNTEGEAVWRELWRNDQVVVLADGLEEALIESNSQNERDDLIRIAIRQANAQRLPLVLTSRPHNSLRDTEAAVVELEPLCEEAALEYLGQGQPGEDSRNLDWIVETADVAEAPLYLQVTWQLHRAGLLTSPTTTRDGQQLDTHDVDRSGLRLRLLDTWKEALVSGYLLPSVALSRDDRIATIEQLSVLACIGLRQGRLQVDLKDYKDLWEWRTDDGQLQPIIREARDRLDRPGYDTLDVRLAVTWGTQLGLVRAHDNAVRFSHSILQAYLGSRLIGYAMANDEFRAEALRNAGEELLIALVLLSRATMKQAGRRERADTAIGGGGPVAEPAGLRTLLREQAGRRSDANALNLYATALEIDSVAAVPKHQAIADEIAEHWQPAMGQYPRTLGQAKLNLVRRFGEAARTISERHSQPNDPAKPAYRQLFEIGCAESSYPVRLAVAQEIGAGGDDALEQLAAVLGPDLANGGHEDDGEPTRRGIVRAWLVPLLVGSATSDKWRATARGLLQSWLDSIHAQHRQTSRERSGLSLEIALAQGFKYAANRRRGHPHAPDEARNYLAEQTQEMLSECDFWFTRLTLLHALTLWHLPDGKEQRWGRAPKPDYKTLVAHWCGTKDRRRRDRSTEHPFVAQAMRLCVRALETGQPERYLWIDESGIVSTVGSTPVSPGRRRKHNLWIPPSTGWTALNAHAQQLVADVLLLLNLAERGEGSTADRDMRLRRTNKNYLPPCIAEDRSPLKPNRPLGTPGDSALGSTCAADCQFGLCPYPQKGAQPHRQELSEAFCRRQQTLLSPGTLRSNAAPWQEMPERRLSGFWKQMEQRALSAVELDRDHTAKHPRSA